MLEGRLCDRQYIIQKWIFAWFENSSYCFGNQCPVQLLSRFFIAYFEDICKIISNDISILRHIFQLNLRSLNSRKILRHIKLILIFQTFNIYCNGKGLHIYSYFFHLPNLSTTQGRRMVDPSFTIRFCGFVTNFGNL